MYSRSILKRAISIILVLLILCSHLHIRVDASIIPKQSLMKREYRQSYTQKLQSSYLSVKNWLIGNLGNLVARQKENIKKTNDKKDSSKHIKETTQIIVKYNDEFKNEKNKDRVKKELKLKKLDSKKKLGKFGYELLEIEQGADVEAIAKELTKEKEGITAQPNYKLETFDLPQDQSFSLQWGLNNTGQVIEGQMGMPAIDINILKAWDVTKGSSDVLIGILDTGIDIHNTEISASIFTNTREIAGNGKDDDNNGYVDDTNGYDFINNDNSVYDSADADAHGTFIAGQVAAAHDGQGICGIAPNVKIVPLKFINDNVGFTFDAIEAIEYAKQLGVEIINCSWGSYNYNSMLKQAMKDSGILFVCAAGNDGLDVAAVPVYPACYDLPNVISVAAIDNRGNIASFSNYGSEIDIAAPGVGIYGIMPNNQNAILNGTSYAAPYVTGAAVLLKSVNPEVNASGIVKLIKRNSKRLENLANKVQTSGILDAATLLLDSLPAEENDEAIIDNDPDNIDMDNTALTAMNQIEPKLLEQIHYGKDGVNPATGNFSRTYTDMSMSLPNQDFSIKRIYNSKDDTPKSFGFGRGWLFNFYAMIENRTSYLRVILPNGKIEIFAKDIDGTYVSQYSRNKLEKMSDGRHILSTPEQDIYEFNAENKLVKITNKYGDFITITWNSGIITKITSSTGKSYTIAYNYNYLINSITDSSGRTVRYEYENDLLVRAIDPAGKVTKYFYDYEKYLEEIRDNNGNRLEYITYKHGTYENNNNHVMTLRDNLGNIFYYSYDKGQRKTTVKDSNNRQIIYWYDNSLYTIKTQDPENKAVTVDYYKDGFVSSYMNAKIFSYKDISLGTLNGKLYFIGGWSNTGGPGSYNASVEQFDIEKNIWSTSAGMKTQRIRIGVTELNGYLYAIGGLQCDRYSNAIERYNSQTNTWDTMASMSVPREYVNVAAVNNKIYAIGGYSGYNSYIKAVEEYNPATNTWIRKRDMPNARLDAKAITLNGKIYLIDGYNQNGNATRVEEYNPINDTWTTKASLPTSLINKRVQAHLLNGKIYVFIGVNGYGYLQEVYEYDPVADTWTFVTKVMDVPYTSVVLNNKIYGFNSTTYDHYYYNTSVYECELLANKRGEEKSIIDRSGNKYDYLRDERGNIIKITNPDLTYREYAYDDKNNVTMEKDELGKAIWYIYDSNKINLIKKAQPLNGTDVYINGISSDDNFSATSYVYYTEAENTALGYKAKGLLKSVTDPECNVTSYTYDTYGNIKTVTDLEGSITEYTYDAIGLKTSETTAKGYRTDYYYDLCGRLEKQVLNNPDDPSQSSVSRIVYDAMGRKTKEISPNLYDPLSDKLNAHTYSGDHGVRYSYNTNSTVASIKDAENNTTSYTQYDKYGNVLSETKPNGVIYQYEYDIMNRLSKTFFKANASASQVLLEENIYEILHDGKTKTTKKRYFDSTSFAVTATIYDYAGRPIEKINPDGTTQKNCYYSNGKIQTTIDQNNAAAIYTYDGMNRLFEIWRPFEKSGDTTLYSYSKTEYYKNNQKKTEYTGKVPVEAQTPSIDLIIKQYQYYRNGRLKTTTDNEGRRTDYYYDADGNISREEIYTDITDPEKKNITEYQYNFMQKPIQKKLYIRQGDIYGNLFESTEDTIALTEYTYDKNGNLLTQKNPLGTITTYTYDNLNRQLTMSQLGTDENGNNTTITTSRKYDWEGKPIEETAAKGNKTNYNYTPLGYLEKITKRVTIDGSVKDIITAFYYDLAGRKTAEILPKHYDPVKTLEQMNRTEYTYDAMNRLKTKIEKYIDPITGLWKTITTKSFEYDLAGNNIKETDALGYSTEFTYNLAGKLITKLDPVSKDRGLAYTEKFHYDTLGRKIKENNAEGAEYNYTYNNIGKMLTKTAKVTMLGQTQHRTMETNTYDLAGNLIITIDGNGNTTTYEYNSFGNVRKVLYPGDDTITANTETFQYDLLGNLKKKADTFGTVELYIYDNQGRVIYRTQQALDGSDSITAAASYDKNGNKRYETDGNGVTKEYIYDELNRQIEERVNVTTIDGRQILHSTKTKYDENNNLIATTDWNNNTEISTYDPLNRLIQKTNAYGKAILRLEYNDNGAQIKSYDALNNLTQFQYDKNNRLINTIDPELHETTHSYDNAGNVHTKTDGRGKTTTYIYDELNRLIKVINAKGEETIYTYDTDGNLLTQTDGKGNTSIYEYNVRNRTTRRIDHGGRTGLEGSYSYDTTKLEAYTYYVNGSMKTKTDRNGIVTSYTYDCHNKQISMTVGTKTITHTYDGNGNRLTMTDDTGTTTYTYDQLNRLISKDVPSFGITKYYLDITIDQDVEPGFTAQKTEDPKGNIQKNVYDKVGRLKHVVADGQKTTYSYYDNGARQMVLYPNNFVEIYTYYANNQLHTLTNIKGYGTAEETVLDTYSYTYDAANNQTSKDETINGEHKGITTYTYDDLNRLQKVIEPAAFLGKVTNYTYDAAGNRLTESVTEGAETITTSYTYNQQNRMTATVVEKEAEVLEATEYSYDGNGNMTTKTRRTPQNLEAVSTIYGLLSEITNTEISTYKYDELNQLKTAIEASGIYNYKYDGDGLRVEKTEAGRSTRYLYENSKVVLEVDGHGVTKARNTIGINIISRQAGINIVYYMYNGHSDVTALIDETGIITATYYYDAFGNIKAQTGTADNPYRYVQYQYDEETGLYYLNARYYDPKTARFMTEDTYRGEANDPLSLNLYTYCQNNPLIYIDPTGHKQEKMEDGNGKSTAGVGSCIRLGDRGNNVKQLQEALVNAGYKISVDGIFGQETLTALKAFQKANGLDADGIAGYNTNKVLYEKKQEFVVEKVQEVVPVKESNIPEILFINSGDKNVDIAYTRWYATNPQLVYQDDLRYDINIVAAFQSRLLYMSKNGIDVSKLTIEQLYAEYEKEANFQVAATIAMLNAAVTITSTVATTATTATATITEETVKTIPEVADSQLGKKLVDHAADYGLTKSKEGAMAYKEITQNVLQNATEIRTGSWKTLGECEFWISGSDVAIIKDGKWVSTFPLSKPGTIEYINSLAIKK